MKHYYKIAAIVSLTVMTSSGAALANSNTVLAATKTSNTPVTISVKQFESQQKSLGLRALNDVQVNTDKAVTVTSQKFNTQDTIELAPRYVLTDNSTAFIGSTRMDHKGFVNYQKSALTPEGRVTEPLESLASIGIRSKF